MKKAVIFIVILLAVVGLGIYLSKQSSKPAQPVVTNDFSSVPRGSTLLGNMGKAGLDSLSAEGTVLHIHQHLDLIVNGKTVTVPAEIGISPASIPPFISPIHTHDTTGILHVESPTVKDFKLGQFFDEWGIDFNDNCIGTNCADSTHKLLVAVNGNKIAKDYHDIVLKAHDEIEVWYGPSSDNPNFIKSYDFPAGL